MLFNALIQNFLSEGVQLWRFFFFYLGAREDPNNNHYTRSIIGCQRNAIEMAPLKWRFAGLPMMAGLLAL